MYYPHHQTLGQFTLCHFRTTQSRLNTTSAHKRAQNSSCRTGEHCSVFAQGCSVTHPRIGNASFGVLKGWQQPHCQVMSQVQQLIVIILDAHVTKGLLGVCNDDVGRQQAPQNPVGKGKFRFSVCSESHSSPKHLPGVMSDRIITLCSLQALHKMIWFSPITTEHL